MDAAQQDRPMPDSYWATICTLRQEPRYRFVGSELMVARRMVKASLLEPKDDRHFAVTPYGLRCYSARKLLAGK
ncbi:hypothetical protein [Burkholderia ubonensis]|uniref:hypothetical protein n=1 Tax=Burkholderia ubonensis TaxID=101571 RepID=UPI00075215D2|nr:hypothetical protein [Burkholderia ubonensis]KVP39739.1 hypothetical protein WJ87_06020 [Burkholderia ubonensis]